MTKRQAQAGRVPVLMYHRVGKAGGAAETRYCIAPEQFADHMWALADCGLWACGIDEFAAWLEGGAELRAGAFLLTFDDGYAGIHEHALPVLAPLGWPATVFLVSNLLGGNDVWRRVESPDSGKFPLLGPAEIRVMQRAGFSFQSHSRTHADLTHLSDEALKQEVAGSKTELEAVLGQGVSYIAYPYGRCDERVLRLVRDAGYRAAFSVESGFNRPGMDLFRLRRLDVFGTDTPAQLRRKILFGTNDGSWTQSVRYYAGRLRARMGIPEPPL